MNRRHIPWQLAALLTIIAGPARADVVPRPPEDCPPPSQIDYNCGLAICRVRPCETDADCKNGTCQPLKGCFHLHDGQFPRLEFGGPCEPDDSCKVAEQTCQTLDICFPSESDDTTGGNPGTTTSDASTTTTATTSSTTTSSTTDTLSTTTTAASTTTTGTSTPTSGEAPTSTAPTSTTSPGASATQPGPESESGCSCTSTSTQGLLALLPPLALVAARRRRITPQT